MRDIEVLNEPQLEFGHGGRHIDIRFGIMDWGPADVSSDRAPKQITIALIGMERDVEALRRWLEKCRDPIPAKESKHPNLFPPFPGFREDAAFRSRLALDSSLERTIPPREIESLFRRGTHNEIVTAAVDLFLDEMRLLKDKGQPDVILCAVPPEIEALMDPDERPGGSRRRERDDCIDFHDLLKARAMVSVDVPTQCVLPGTYDPQRRRQQKRRKDRVRTLQDEATRAWNLHTALYYKAGGLPWRMVRHPSEYQACYIGIGFYYTPDREFLRTSMAQVFGERGDGVIVRGSAVAITKEDRTPHLSEEAAAELVQKALRRYRAEHRTAPARVVLHKTSRFSPDERKGFTTALEEEKIELVDLISFDSRSAPRLFRVGKYPVLRGTFVSLSSREHVLYTRGAVPFYETYPGMHVPRPLLVHLDEITTSSAPEKLAQEILALTKMNWNQTQFDQRTPITIYAADKVGKILKYVDDVEDDKVQRRYSYYM